MKLPTLERMVQVPVVFDIVPDTSCVERVRAAISTAEVVVTRRWPSDPVAAPKLRLIQHVGAGTDSYHRDSLPPTAYLCNVYEHEASIAEHVFMVLFALRRSLFALDRNLRHGDWSRNQNGQAQLLGDLSGLTLGIIGFGRIGRSLVFPAQAFDMEIIGVTGKPVRGDPPDGLRFLGGPEDLDLVLKDSDVSCRFGSTKRMDTAPHRQI
jgi:phosphoglycerate dehydrogenase-like enzyme